jgi:hypothetical protein
MQRVGDRRKERQQQQFDVFHGWVLSAVVKKAARAAGGDAR